MSKRRAIRLIVALAITMAYIFGMASVFAEGLLPSLSETVGIAMPSLGEALQRYPDSETENEDGSVTELYTNVSESDFNTFSVYLEQQEAQLADYKAEKGVLTAEIRAKGASFSLQYDSKAGEAKVTYPSGTFDERMKSAKTHYDTGKELLNAGKKDEALAEFLSISQYSEYIPVADLLETNDNLAAAAVAAARDAKLAPYKEVGGIVTFGIYPQTEAGTDQMPIEWIVLDYDEVSHKALLISRYGLEVMRYNTERTDITWEKCTLRTWLNGEFLNKAFSTTEQSAILMTQVDNSKSQGYSAWDTNSGNNTEDRIFLLSYAEANRYMGVAQGDSSNLKSRVAPTAYALAQGAWTSDNYKTEDGAAAGCWWLRSPGDGRRSAALVDTDGSLDNGYVIAHGVVRPAFWLNLESDIF